MFFKKNKHRVLFILKRRANSYGISYGLTNSAQMIANLLIRKGHEAKVIDVIDGNYIDREVHQYKPTHVFIEALWTPPSKIKEVAVRYPTTPFYIRIHSEIPFIANEGIAITWLRELCEESREPYSNIKVSANAWEAVKSLTNVFKCDVSYTPNAYYPTTVRPTNPHYISREDIHISCFGAIRPMKNQLHQAMAAITYANQIKRTLHFYMNCDRSEQRGEQVLKNIKALFNDSPHHLVNIGWLHHTDFIYICRIIDIGMQVSLSETFNIVTADHVYSGTPMVVSEHIDWMPQNTWADPHDIDSMIKRLYENDRNTSWCSYSNIWRNYRYLNRWNRYSTNLWIKELKKY